MSRNKQRRGGGGGKAKRIQQKQNYENSKQTTN